MTRKDRKKRTEIDLFAFLQFISFNFYRINTGATRCFVACS